MRTRRPWLLWIAVSSVVVLALAGWLWQHPATGASQTLGDLAILCCALAAAVSCSLAARRDKESARAWWFIAAAAFVWFSGMAVWTIYGLTLDHAYPFPSPADALFIGYAVPAAIGLFSFPRPTAPGAQQLRTVLDAAVIASSALFISWVTVLGPIYKTEAQDVLSWLTTMGYPIVDVALASLVFVLTMRRSRRERLQWACLGCGVVVLAVTDSIYVRMTAEGITGSTGTPLAAGWMCAFLLIGLAPLVPHSKGVRREPLWNSLALEMLPYVPAVGAVVASPQRLRDEADPVLVVTGVSVFVLVVIRQFFIIYQNVTLTRHLEAKVAARTAELEGLGAIVNSSADAIIGKSPEGIITSWNPAAERLYGYHAAEAVGRHADFIIPARLRAQENAYLAEVASTGTTHTYETERVRGDGLLVPVSLTVSPISGTDGIHGVATIARDITDRIRNEAELVAARETAEEASRLKSEFLATMSHEIRTPMNGVIGLTGVLLDTELDERQRQYANGVRVAADALLSLINDILDFSKLEAGKVELDPEPFDPRLLVEEVAGLLAEAAREKDLELMAYCRPEVPVSLLGDARRIRQVLLNLASNAVKFTEAGEVAIRVGLVGDGADVATVRFEVRDTGIGIDEADHDRLFEPFLQADASTTRKYGGTGLGLAICRRLTEAMGGEIGLTSTPGSGSTFWITVPLPVTDPTSLPAQPPYAQTEGLRVLVVDDNASNRMILEAQLAGWKMQADAVGGARHALKRAREEAGAGHPYDIAVLDMCMPEMDGVELARLISADEALKSMKLILLTSTTQVDRQELKAAGIREWLTKPVRSSEFYDRLIRLIAGPVVPARAATPAALHGQDHRGEGLVLVVEDNDINKLVARSMVEKLGYAVDVVSDGAEAVAATAARHYDAVLMDCHMPVLDGFEATRIIRGRTHSGPRIPIIAMTAGAMDEDRERCLDAGMDDYLSKPVDELKLRSVLAQWVPRKAPDGGVPADESAAPAAEAGSVRGTESGSVRGTEADSGAEIAGVAAMLPPELAGPVLDPARLATLRSLGPADGRGLLPAAAQAFKGEILPSLEGIRAAAASGGDALGRAAHKLKGAAVNIGATRAAGLCQQLEHLGSGSSGAGLETIEALEAELALVAEALDEALFAAP
ncbi:PAS domain-containing hybrid sensor histidine kinase/response regulator [Arthrobacter silvisoli]|uniref:PAS domain-containing hybrid sensor histidine kinase/response regulator n=1 Tax=Arthrobacter silvisoli TaxID=2291022 RepID=UPI000E2138C5|nr:response regulator [Arthrobacter silvisoli]